MIGGGASFRFNVAVWTLLNYECSVRWLGRKEQIAWPALSPDLDLLDLYLGGHHKSTVGLHAAVFNNLAELHQRPRGGFESIRNTAGISECSVQEHNSAL